MTEVKEENKICRKDDVVKSISKLFLATEYSDVTFIVEGHKLPAHRNILAASCEYFRGLLFGDFKEAKQDKIELDEPVEAFKLILKYIYTGCIDLNDITDTEVINLLCITHKFDINHVMPEVAYNLQNRLSLLNVCDILTVASAHSFRDLEMAALKIIDENTMELIKGDHLRVLSKELLSDVISRDSLTAPELDIFKAVLAWGKNKSKEELKSVMKNVRFALLQVYEMREVVEPTGVLEPVEVNEAIKQIKTLKDLPFRNAKLHRNQWASFELNERETKNYVHSNQSEFIIFEMTSEIFGNNIDMVLPRKKNFHYNIDVSCDEREWRRVVTYEDFPCHGEQTLYFDMQSIRYVCIQFRRERPKGIDNFKIWQDLRYVPILLDGFIVTNVASNTEMFQCEDTDLYKLYSPLFVNCVLFNNSKELLKLESSLNGENFKDLPIQSDTSNRIYFFEPHAVIYMRFKLKEISELKNINCFFSNLKPSLVVK